MVPRICGTVTSAPARVGMVSFQLWSIVVVISAYVFGDFFSNIIREGENLRGRVVHGRSDNRDHALAIRFLGRSRTCLRVRRGNRGFVIQVCLFERPAPDDVGTVRPVHHAVQHAAGQDQAQVAPVEGEWWTADLKGHRLLESTVEGAVRDLLVQLLIGEGVLPERVGTPRVGDLPHVEISLAGIAWRSFYPRHWLDLAKRRDLLNLEGIPPTHVHFIETANGLNGVLGKDFLPPLAHHCDFFVLADLLAVLVPPIGEPVDADVFKVRIEKVNEDPRAGQSGERADQNQDALRDQQGRYLLAERHLLPAPAFKLLVKGRVDVGKPKAVTIALNPKE